MDCILLHRMSMDAEFLLTVVCADISQAILALSMKVTGNMSLLLCLDYRYVLYLMVFKAVVLYW